MAGQGSWPYYPAQCSQCHYFQGISPTYVDDSGYEILGFCRHPRIAMELFAPQQVRRAESDRCPLFVPDAGCAPSSPTASRSPPVSIGGNSPSPLMRQSPRSAGPSIAPARITVAASSTPMRASLSLRRSSAAANSSRDNSNPCSATTGRASARSRRARTTARHVQCHDVLDPLHAPA